MIRTYWVTVFKTQSLTKNSNNAPTIIIIVVKKKLKHTRTPTPSKEKVGKGGRKDAFASGRKKSCSLAPVHRNVNR